MKSVVNILPTIEKDDLNFFAHHEKASSAVWEDRIKKQLYAYFPNSTILLFESARAALDFTARTLLHRGDKLYTQAFTCSAVVYPFMKNDVTPLYVDIDKETLNMNSEDLLKKKDAAGQALLIQYTFGLMPKKLKEIISFAKKNKLILIEDLAHSFGNKFEGKYVGNFGDVAVLSFGRDKVITSVAGGALIIRNSAYKKHLFNAYQKLPSLNKKQQGRFVFYLRFMTWIKKQYHHKFARVLIFLAQKLGLIDLAVSKEEKKGMKTSRLPHTFPSRMFPLLYYQLNKLPEFIKQRQQGTANYNRQYKKSLKGALLKYPVFEKNPDEIVKKVRVQNIYLDRWYSNVIDPAGVSLAQFSYQKGSCPQAEEAAREIVNLPTLHAIPHI